MRRKRAACLRLLGACWMMRHMNMRRKRRAAAHRIGAAWRGYCVRMNLAAKDAAKRKIVRWWRGLKVKIAYSRLRDKKVTVEATRQRMLRIQKRWAETDAVTVIQKWMRGLLWLRRFRKRKSACLR